ncbi:MAG: hybrid sensor histidine kinase/response regulator [Acidobacteria bacterium]|nr:MAG: hybrid sensor histidine kinase/response regulator [Acidobacteriota bacterium]
MANETDLAAEAQDLRTRLLEAEETLRAIRRGEVDALVVEGGRGEQIYTLKGADHSYRIFLEAMHEGAATLTADGVILYCNRRFAEMARVPLEDVIGSSLRRFVRPADLPELAAVLREGLNGTGKRELCFQTGAETMPVYLTASTLPLDDGEEPAICLVMTDLTERKRSERLVADEKLARQEAEAANQAKDHFLATLSHELRTPLTPVLAVLSGLQENPQIPADVRPQLAMMRRNVELEARLIDDMLDLTRIARGKLELRREVADLRQAVDHALQTARADLFDKGLRLSLDLAEDDYSVWADTPRLTQVFWNLFSNAVKFTPPGGAITVRSWREEAATGLQLVVEVEDTGIGIEPDVLSGIFDAFQQGEQAITRRFGGLGLGLAISKAIVELHGGHLTAASDGRDRGAKLTVRLPVGDLRALREAERSSPAREVPAPGPEPEIPPLRILLVEDHADTAEAMADLLREMGHEVTVAGSVAGGLAAAEGHAGRIDLVLSDLGLPDGTGLDLMTELHGRYGVRGIALSGYGMEEDVRKSLEAGFDRHLTKPVNLQALQTAIQDAARG